MSTDGLELTINAMQARSLFVLRADFPRLQAPALSRYPTSLDTAALPMLLTWPADGTWYLKGDGFAEDTRTMTMTGYLAPIGQDDIPSRVLDSVRMLEALINLWLTRASIALIDPGSNAGGYQATIESAHGLGHSDGGVMTGPVFGGTRYEGFVLRIRTRIAWVVTQ